MIKVSFVVIGYNVSPYIERCIQSIINQTMDDIEIIFVNDGSADNSEDIVKLLSKIDNRIKIINQKNSGANVARKTGFLNSTAQYVVFVDGDDWIEPDLAKDMYNMAIEYDYDIIAYGHYFVNDNKKRKDIIRNTGLLKENQYLDLILERKLSHNLWNKFFSKSFLEKANFIDIPDITMGDDLAANVRFGLFNPNVLVIQECYYNYYKNEKSVTRNISPKVLEIEETIKDIESNLKSYNLLDNYEKHIEFIRFRNFYSRVVKSTHKDCEIRRKLYLNWKNSRVKIKSNELCIDFIKSKGVLERVLMYLYNYNYKLGYIVSKIYLNLFAKQK